MSAVVAAVRDFLVDAGVASGRVFGGSLPDDQDAHMPRRAVVVRAAGGAGTFGGGYMPVTDRRVDVRCYGAGEWDAGQLSDEVDRLLHHVRDAATSHGRIKWARQAGGPADVTETDTSWQFVLTSWQVFGGWLEESP